MSTDYEDKEREFLTYLKADTGRDLAGWMSAINEAKLAHRNEIIDWLRQQGFIFAWASWMERIHHNGGRPIYLDEAPASLAAPPRSAPGSRQPATAPPPPASAAPEARAPGSRTGAPTRKDSPAPKPPASKPPASAEPPARQPPDPQPPAAKARPVLVYSAPAPQEPPQPAPPAEPAPVPPAAQPASPSTATPSQSEPQLKLAPAATSAPTKAPAQAAGLSPEVSALIAKAKAYTPLAGFILRSIAEALPETALQVSGGYVSFNRPGTFAILVPGPKDIKLGLALASAPFGREVVAARFPNLSPAPPKSVTYMAVLTDARQVDAALLDLLRSADAAVNG